MRRCRCGHFKNAHEHFREGLDCAWCVCPRYRRGGWFSRLIDWMFPVFDEEKEK